MIHKLKYLLMLCISCLLIVSCQPGTINPVENNTDDDDDGVSNTLDQCANTGAGIDVDNNGCPIIINDDKDNDGVVDLNDQCANTIAGSIVDAKGCVVDADTDSDLDGVSNDLDLCPNTALNIFVDLNGCEIIATQDQDLDGIKDTDDQCENTLMNEVANLDGCSIYQIGAKHYQEQSCALCHGDNGLGKADVPEALTNFPVDVCQLVDCTNESDLTAYIDSYMPTNDPKTCSVANNCAQSITAFMIKYIVIQAQDSDLDGVFDNVDQCLTTPLGLNVNSIGCAPVELDSDNDMVNDQLDLCANTPLGSNVDVNGCSISTSNDTDGDNILNENDSCPNTKSEYITLIDEEGCSSYDRGLEHYFANLGGGKSCADCHGSDGAGANGGGAINKVCDSVDCQNINELSVYLKDEMPYNSAYLCVDSTESSCASDIAFFMNENFYNQDENDDVDYDGIKNNVDECVDTKSEDISSIDSTGCKNTNLIIPTVFAINAGGTEFVSRVTNDTYISDSNEYYENSNGSTQGEKTHEVTNTQDDELYRNERWGKALEYNIPLSKGNYIVELHLAEVYHEETEKRVMQVFIEGDSVLNDYDIFAQAGGKNAAKIERIENIELNDDVLNINLNGKTDNASIVAIRILGEPVNDGDDDGIYDARDLCPGTLMLDVVDSNGCSIAQLDKDNDGVLLPIDVCPITPINQITTVENTGFLAGCSFEERQSDDDGDGVANVIDNCVSNNGDNVGVTGCSGDFNLNSSVIHSAQMRLTSVEFGNVVMQAFNKTSLPNVTYQGDSKGPFGLFTNNGDDLSGDFSVLVESAIVLGDELSNDLQVVCDWESSTENCIRTHLQGPMQTLYRQNNISSDDISVIKSVMEQSFSNESNAKQALATGIARILIDDRTVYQMELGLNPEQSGKIELTANEFLDRISFTLINDAPDSQLQNIEGLLQGDSIMLQQQIDRLMLQENYKENIWLFVVDWLNLPTASGTNMNNINDAAIEESKRLVMHVVENNRPITEIFTADYSFINQTLADHYGVTAPENDWDKVEFLPADNRKGILTHASFLMKTGAHTRDVNTIFRGKVVYEGLFCEDMPPTPPVEDSVELAGIVSDRGTHRDCAGCHSKVDPIGRIFDQYDNEGKVYNDREYHGGLYMDVDIANSYDSVPEFVEQLSDSKAFNQCIARQLVRFSLGRDANANEQVSFNAIRTVLDDPNDGTFNSAFSALLTSQTFNYVHVTQQNSCPQEN